MWNLFILFVITMFKAEAQGADNDPVEITFKIHAELSDEGAVNMICDHTDEYKNGNRYTVVEGEKINIYTKYKSFINHVICHDYFNNSELRPFMEKTGSKDIITFKAERTMGCLWNCTVLLHRDLPSSTFPKVQYKGVNYTAAYCYMRIHVRQSKSPQTILVNNMQLPTVRIDLTEKDVDFTAEYQYVDGDIVNVTCANLLNPDKARLMMKGTMIDQFTVVDLYSQISFIAILRSDQHNSYVICLNYEESGDYTTVMVRFVMRTEFSATSTSNTLLYGVSAAGVAVIAILVVGGYWTFKKRYCCVRSSLQELRSMPTPRPDPASIYYQNLRLSIFKSINERETAEMEMENIHEEFQ